MKGSNIETTVNIKKLIIIFVYALVGWALWVAKMYYGWSTIFNVTVVPIIFAVLSLIYFKKFNYTAPFLTAILFTGFVIVDFLVLAFLRSLDVIAILSELWIPFALIFGSTYLTGVLTVRNANSKVHKNAVVAISAIVSALGSGVFGLFIGAMGWGMWENATPGAFIGFVVGLVVGICCAIKLLANNYPNWKAIVYSLLMALLISGLFVVVLNFIIVGSPY